MVEEIDGYPALRRPISVMDSGNSRREMMERFFLGSCILMNE
jgi:hypothetical protein